MQVHGKDPKSVRRIWNIRIRNQKETHRLAPLVQAVPQGLDFSTSYTQTLQPHATAEPLNSAGRQKRSLNQCTIIFGVSHLKHPWGQASMMGVVINAATNVP